MSAFNPYKVLNVDAKADAAAIKKAYRKLAKKHHPDRGGDEARFKDIGRANDILSDPEKRSAFDRYGAVGLESGFDPRTAQAQQRGFGQGHQGMRGGFGPQGVSVEDLMSQLFGGQAPRGRRPQEPRGVDAELSLDLRTSVEGGVRTLTTSAGSMTVRIPPGVRDGETLRLKGQGARVGGASGSDLHLTLRIEAHPVFTRKGNDVHVDVPITVSEAVAGGTVPVPTLDGRVTVQVPAGSPSGRTLRVRGKGVARRGQTVGDLYVHLDVALPDTVDPSVLAQLDAAYNRDVRAGLMQAAAA